MAIERTPEQQAALEQGAKQVYAAFERNAKRGSPPKQRALDVDVNEAAEFERVVAERNAARAEAKALRAALRGALRHIRKLAMTVHVNAEETIGGEARSYHPGAVRDQREATAANRFAAKVEPLAKRAR